MFQLTQKFKNGLVLMHTPAPPKIMQSKVNSYKNVVSDIKKIFQTTLKTVDKYKIPHSKIWFDHNKKIICKARSVANGNATITRGLIWLNN